MCDYSLEAYKSRPAVEGDDLVVKQFSSLTKGFVESADSDCAVCCKDGVEMTLILSGKVVTKPMVQTSAWTTEAQTEEFDGEIPVIFHKLASRPGVFCLQTSSFHKDGFLLPSGRFLSLQELEPGTRATVTKALPKEIADAATVFDADIKLEMVPDYKPAPALV